jgi:hypothetical protein
MVELLARSIYALDGKARSRQLSVGRFSSRHRLKAENYRLRAPWALRNFAA